MTNHDDRRYKLAEELIDRKIGDDLLLHRFDNDEVFVFNAHARVVFDAVKAGGTRTEILRYVAEKGFGGEEALAAVDRALQQMLDEGIALVEQPAASQPG
jgi:hypothetical protein